MSNSADRLLRGPSVLGATVPILDDSIHIANQNGIVREIQKVGLLPQTSLLLLLGTLPRPFDGDSRGEREIIEAALAERRGRVSGPSGTASKLRIPPSTLESKIKTLKIRKSQYKFLLSSVAKITKSQKSRIRESQWPTVDGPDR